MSDEGQDDQPIFSKPPRFRFTIGSLLILTTVVAASGVSLNFFVKALRAEDSDTAIGTFAIVAAMTPTVFLVIASWFLKTVAFVTKRMK